MEKELVGFKELSFKEKGVTNVFGSVGRVSKEVLEDTSISRQARFLYAVLRTFVRYSPKSKYYGKTTLSDTFFTKGILAKNRTMEQNKMISSFTLSEDFMSKYRKELIEKEILTAKYSQPLKSWIYTFSFDVKSNYEHVTKKFILTDKLILEEKIFLIALLPHIFSDSDIIEYSDLEISKKIGLAYNTVQKHMNSLLERDLITLTPYGRRINLGLIQSGIDDNYAIAIQEIFNYRTHLKKASYTEEEINKIAKGQDVEVKETPVWNRDKYDEMWEKFDEWI